MPTPLQVLSKLSIAPSFSAKDITKLMMKLELNEKAFALLMNVTPMTVRLWTAGAVSPCGLSRRLLQIYLLHPQVITVLAEQSSL